MIFKVPPYSFPDVGAGALVWAAVVAAGGGATVVATGGGATVVTAGGFGAAVVAEGDGVVWAHETVKAINAANRTMANTFPFIFSVPPYYLYQVL